MLNLEKHGWTRPSSILVATDLADVDRLFPVALDRAIETGARLLLLHVLTPANTILLDPNGLPFYDPTEALRFAEKSLDPHRIQAQNAGVDCSVMVREGAAPQQIIAAARQLSVDLLVLGTKSRGRLGKLLLGSVAEQVLRSVPVPVLTVGPEAHPHTTAPGLRRTVLHATTLQETSHKSATLACELARSLNAKLVLLHVLSAFNANKNDVSELQKCTEKELRRLIPSDMICSCAAEARVAVGNPAIEILAEAVDRHADVIVLGASKPSTLQKLARDGTIYRILAHAPCPVLTILDEEANAHEKSSSTVAETLHSAH